MAKVLICESQRHITRLLQVNLERQGHTVQIEANGQSCLGSLRRNAVETLLLGAPQGMTSEEMRTAIQSDPEIEVRVTVIPLP